MNRVRTAVSNTGFAADENAIADRNAIADWKPVQTKKKPNIVMYFSDQQRFDTLGCNGQTLDVTPNLDILAKEGINYTRAYTAQPVCGPARAMLQTGLYPTELGCFRNGISLPRDRRTLAHRMRAAGYMVAYVGKWHLATDHGGFDCERGPVPLERRGGYDDYWMASDILEFTSHGYGGYVHDGYGNKVEFSGYRPDCITDYALHYLDQRSAGEEKPFFIFVSQIEPHHQNDHDCFEGPVGSREKFGNFIPPADLEPGKGDWEKQLPDYFGCCNALDANLGRVIAKLKERGLYDDTLVIYTSDHGCHFKTKIDDRTPGGFDDYKRNCYENTIHIPMIISGPGFRGGQKADGMVSLLDIPKTIVMAAGADASGMRGDPLQNLATGASDTTGASDATSEPDRLRTTDAPGMRGSSGASNASAGGWKRDVYIQISESYLGRAIRTKRYTYCVYDPSRNPNREASSNAYIERYLFDNETDPAQKRNRVGDPALAGLRADLRNRLVELARDSGEGDISIAPATI